MAQRFLPRAMAIALAAGMTVTGVQVAPDFAAEAQAATAEGKVPEAAKYNPMYNDLRVGPKSTVTSAPYFGNSPRAPHASFRLGHSEIPKNLHVNVDERTGVITARTDEVTQFASAKVRVHIQYWDTTENVVDVNILLSPVGDDFINSSNSHLLSKVDKKAQNPTKIVGVRDPFKGNAPMYRPSRPIEVVEEREYPGAPNNDARLPEVSGPGRDAPMPPYSMADQHQPEYPAKIRVKQGEEGFMLLRHAVPNATYALSYGPKWLRVDKDTGEVTVVKGIDKETGPYQGTVKVTYSDGSVDYTFINVDILPGPTQDNPGPVPPKPKTKPEAPKTSKPEAPKPETSKPSKPSKPETSKPETKPAPKTQAEKANDWYKEYHVPRLSSADRFGVISDGVKGATYVLKSAPSWVSINKDNGTLIFNTEPKKDGTYTAVVGVTYPDGSSKDHKVTLKIVDPVEKYADIFNPRIKDVTIEGSEIVSAPMVGNPDEFGVTGTKYTLENGTDWMAVRATNGDFGATTAFGADVAPGTYTPVLVATYPDGSVDRVPFKVVVKPAGGTSAPGSSIGSSLSSSRVEKGIRDAIEKKNTSGSSTSDGSSRAISGSSDKVRDVVGSSGGGSSIDTARKVLPAIGTLIGAAPGLSKEAQDIARGVQNSPNMPKPIVDGARDIETNLRGADGMLRDLQGSSARVKEATGLFSKILNFFRG